MNPQPLVFRVSYKSYADMQKAFDTFEGIGVFGDHMAPDIYSPTWRVIFTDQNTNLAKVAIRRAGITPSKVEVFDPESDWQNDFKMIQL